jgi:hypothetical protein
MKSPIAGRRHSYGREALSATALVALCAVAAIPLYAVVVAASRVIAGSSRLDAWPASIHEAALFAALTLAVFALSLRSARASRRTAPTG